MPRRSPPPYGELIFSEATEPTQGFTSNDADRDRTKDETVIRELIQNALDASTPDSAEPTTVSFKDICVEQDKLTHIDKYRKAFDSARRLLGKDEPQTGKQAISRIAKQLEKPKIRSLVCIDHGEGIDTAALQALYSQGRSTKQRGRGSVGAGHLTAFAPSDLRYVLYAGKGSHGCTFGGHAILATHGDDHESGGVTRFNNHGYIRVGGDDAPRLFEDDPGASQIPEILADHIPAGGGSAVMICGYGPLASSKKDLSLLVRSAAARDFLVQIFLDRLQVNTPDGDRLERDSLDAAIAQMTPKTRLKEASRMLRTIKSGRELAGGLPAGTSELSAGTSGLPPGTNDPPAGTGGPPAGTSDLPAGTSGLPAGTSGLPTGTSGLPHGTQVWFRSRLEGSEEAQTRVWMFRDGMFIERNTRGYLDKQKFAEVAPFDAVVNASSDEEFGKLIRQAEGVSHNQIRPSEIEIKTDQDRLETMLKALAEKLQSEADALPERVKVYEPPELKLSVLGDQFLKPTPKRNTGGDETHDGPRNEPRSKREARRRNGGGGSSEGGRTRMAGNSTGVSTTCRADSSDSEVFHVDWSASKPFSRSSQVWLRLYLPSGTDQTSQRKIKPHYYKIKSVLIHGEEQIVEEGPDGEARIRNPSGSGSARVQIEDGSFPSSTDMDRGLVRVEILRRRPQQPDAHDKEAEPEPEAGTGPEADAGAEPEAGVGAGEEPEPGAGAGAQPETGGGE